MRNSLPDPSHSTAQKPTDTPPDVRSSRRAQSAPLAAISVAVAALLAACGGADNELPVADGRAGPLAATTAPAANTSPAASPADAASADIPALLATDTIAPASATSVTTVATGLANPWSLAFMPDGRMLVTEKPGRLRIVTASGSISAPLAGVPQVDAAGQGGLLEVAVALDFATTRRVFLSYAERGTGAEANRNGLAVGTAVLSADDSTLLNWQVIHRQLPKVAGTSAHYGGRLVLAPGNVIYITHGDRSLASERGKAQDLTQGHGKVFRLDTTGTPLERGPFDWIRGVQPGLWSYGHRNPQGAALHPVTGDLWTHEHGPLGGDELNRTIGGGNFGWPLVSYGCEYGGSPGNCTPVGGASIGRRFVTPTTYWVPTSIAPSGLAIHSGNAYPQWQGDFFIGALAGRALWRLRMNGAMVAERIVMLTEQGQRIRDVREGPDGALYLLTDSSNGRLLRVVPQP